MVHAGALALEEKISRGGNPFQALTRLVIDLFLDTFCHERHILQQMGEYRLHGKLMEAADCAIELGHYKDAFDFYEALGRDNRLVNIHAAELAENLGLYQQALTYRLRAEDFAFAALDAARLGRTDEVNKYWKKLREE